MLTTTEFRSHWLDTATGARSERRHPYDGLTPVLNMEEVQGWLSISTSNEMRRLTGGDDARVFYVRQFLLPYLHEAERERLAPLICEELTDDVPNYRQELRGVFTASRERWPLPPMGPSTIVNLTPHEIRVGEFAIPPSGAIARATELATPAEPILVSIPDPTGAPTDRLDYRVPTSTVRHTGTVDLPAPRACVFLVVSTITAQAAAASRRHTADLLVPGEPVRDGADRIVGCRSLARVAP